MAISLTNATAQAACNAAVDRVDQGASAGRLKIYDGTVPADADTALSGNTLLATLIFSDPAFGAAADANPGATATANAITNDSSADATGTATFFRVTDSDDAVLWQGTVTGTGGGGDLELTTDSIVATQPVSVTSLTHTQPES